jgi:hypothetical protein
MVVPLRKGEFYNYVLNPEWMALHPPSHFWPEEKYTDLFPNKEAMQWPSTARVPTPPPTSNEDLNELEREALERERELLPPSKTSFIEKNWQALKGISMLCFLGERNEKKGARGAAPTRFVQHPDLDWHFVAERFTHNKWKAVPLSDVSPYNASSMNRNRVWVVIEGPHTGRYCMGKKTDSNEGSYLVKFVNIDLTGNVNVEEEEAGIPREYLVVIDQTPAQIRKNPEVAQESKFAAYRKRQKLSKVQNAS